MIDMASKQIIPAVIKYTKDLADTVVAVKRSRCRCICSAELLTEVSGLVRRD